MAGITTAPPETGRRSHKRNFPMVALLILLTAGFVAGVRFLRPAPRTLPDQIGQARAIRFSPDGSTLAVTSSDFPQERAARIQLWNVQTGKLLRTLPTFSYVAAPLFSPNGQMVAALTQSSHPAHPSPGNVPQTEIRVWDVNSGRLVLQTTSVASVIAASLDFDASSEHLIENGSAIKLWNLQTGKLEKTYTQHSYYFYGSPTRHPLQQNGRLVVFLERRANKKTAKVMEAATGKTLYALPLMNTRLEKFSPNATQIALTRSQPSNANSRRSADIELWDMQSGKRLHKWDNGDQKVIRRSLDFLSDGESLTWGENLLRRQTEGGEPLFYSSRIVCVDTVSGKVRWAHQVKWYVWLSFFWHDGNTVVAYGGGSSDDPQGRVQFYDAATGQLVRTIFSGRSVDALGFSPDGNTLAVGDGKAVHLWDVSDVRRKTSH